MIKTYSINSLNSAFSEGSSVILFASDCGSTINANKYNLGNAYILIFDKGGRLVEGGYNIRSHEGSVQNNAHIPENGFAVIFGEEHPLYEVYLTVTEGAFIPCCTVSLDYPLFASADIAAMTLSLDLGERKAGGEAKRYLFVGNSGTYIGGVPLKFKALCRAVGIDVEVDYFTFGGAYLYQYADSEHEYGIELRKRLSEREYDFIVLQDGQNCELQKRISAFECLFELINQNGAKPLIYMRHGYGSDYESRLSAGSDIYGSFAFIADEYGVAASPYASAFLTCLVTHPEIELYADDNAHQSSAASYLAACCLICSFLGISPVGNGYTAGLDGKTAEILQKIAEDECERFEARK